MQALPLRLHCAAAVARRSPMAPARQLRAWYAVWPPLLPSSHADRHALPYKYPSAGLGST